MKRFLALCILVFVGVATWIIGSKLSADAIGMGVGVLFGVMAGIPTALLLLASNRRVDTKRRYDAPPPRYPSHAPVIVLAGGTNQPHHDCNPYGGRQGYAPALPDPEGSILPPVPWDDNGYAPTRPTVPAHRNWAEEEDW